MFKQVPTINVLEVADDIFVIRGVPVKGYADLRHHFMVNYPGCSMTLLHGGLVEKETKLHWAEHSAVKALLEQ